MEAPEKIYIDSDENWHRTYTAFTEKAKGNDIEYTRSDVFIERACNGIDKLLSGYIIRNFHFGDSYNIDRLIEDFKNYMKGE